MYTEIRGLLALGIILIIAGATLTGIFLTTDTSVMVDYGEYSRVAHSLRAPENVVNLDKVNQKQNGILIGISLSLMGGILLIIDQLILIVFLLRYKEVEKPKE